MSAALLYGLVILSAIAHSIWNALVKSAGDRTLTMVAIRVAGLVFGLCALPFVDWPAPESWKWLGLTALIQFGYYALLIRSYGVGDMSVVYPLARGAAVGFALATGVSVAAYSFSSGVGVRAAGTVLGFQACLEIVTGLGMVAYALATRRSGLRAYARRHGAIGLLAGAISVIGFLAFLAAAQSLPLGPVVALRETSVIFGAVLGTLVLKEGFGVRRIVASGFVVGGIALLAFAS